MERSASITVLEHLLANQPHVWRGLERRASGEGVPSGYAALDAALPDGGWRRGSVTELLVDTSGIGELSLALPMLRALTADGRHAVLVNPPHVPYAPALENAGVALERLIVVDCDSDGDALWASEQLLRDGVVALLALWVTRTTPARQRRLQLAAEGGRTVALVYRPSGARAEHSPVGARLALEVRDGRLVLDLVKVRGGRERRVLIDPAAFDAAQGVEWPLVPAAVTSPSRDVTHERAFCGGPPDAKSYGDGPYGAESHGTESHGTESHGTESHGTESYGTESYGTESYGTESYGTESHDGEGVEPAPIVALVPTALPDAPVRFADGPRRD